MMYYYYTHFPDKKIEVQKVYITCSESESLWMQIQNSNTGLSDAGWLCESVRENRQHLAEVVQPWIWMMSWTSKIQGVWDSLSFLDWKHCVSTWVIPISYSAFLICGPLLRLPPLKSTAWTLSIHKLLACLLFTRESFLFDQIQTKRLVQAMPWACF